MVTICPLFSACRAGRGLRRLAVLAAVVLPAGFPAFAGPSVVASLPPIHSLAAGVMAGIGEPILLVPGGRSPHDYAMRPSDARALARADLVVWVGPTVETFLERPLAALAPRHRVIRLDRVAGIRRLPLRASGVWDGPGHDHGKDGAGAAYDGHLWLSPDNARAIAGAIAEALATHDAANATRYRANAAALTRRIAALDAEIARTLAAVKGARYVVFHDAYQYFERHFGLSSVGAIAISPERSPSAGRLSEIRRAIRQRDARCVFREPQFAPALAETAVAGSGAQLGVLDPLGAALNPGPDQWFALMRGLARSLATCLARRS